MATVLYKNLRIKMNKNCFTAIGRLEEIGGEINEYPI